MTRREVDVTIEEATFCDGLNVETQEEPLSGLSVSKELLLDVIGQFAAL